MRLTLASKASLLTVLFGFFLILFLMILMSVGVLIGLGGVFLTLGRKLPVSLNRLIILKTPDLLTFGFNNLKISLAVFPFLYRNSIA